MQSGFEIAVDVLSVRYLLDMGVDADLAIVAARVPNDKISSIPLRDALEIGLVTAVVDSV